MILQSYRDKDTEVVNEVGGKAANLAWLSARGYHVPKWRVIPANYFLVDKSSEKSLEINSEIKEWMDGCGLDSIAVRSSMVGEDSRACSFAGQLKSYMNLKNAETIEKKIDDCYFSAFSDLNKNYLKRQEMKSDSIRMSVILQEMIEGEKSGVLFTTNPVNGCRAEYVISAGFGLGEGIVSGQVDCDEWTLSALDGQVLKSEITTKKKIVKAAREGIETEDLSTEQSLSHVLSSEELEKLYRLGKSITKQKGYPQDIEWTIKGENLYVLQTRDVVSLADETPVGEPYVFNNSNIQESFCGLTSPLTFSFAREAYHQVYSQLMEIMGFSRLQVMQEDRRHSQMLALVRGRVYYNINSWYRGLLLLPSFGRNKRDMEKMMGIEEPIDFVVDLELGFLDKIKKIPQVLFLLIRVGIKMAFMPKLFSRFRARFYTDLEAFKKGGLFGRSAEELQGIINEAKESFLKSWDAPVINDFCVMMSSGKVRRELEKLESEELYGDVLAGEDLESVNPTKELIRISDYIKSKPVVRSAYLENVDNMSVCRLERIDKKLAEMVAGYIEKYGDRVMGELKLESLSLHEDPSFVFQIIGSFCQDEKLNLKDWQSREQQRRASSEKQIRQKIGFLKWYFFKKKLNQLRQSVRFREAMRLDRTRSFGFFRQAYRAMGYALLNRGCLEKLEDIFYLSTEEIESFLCGQAFFDNPKNLVQLRKDQYKKWEEEDAPCQLEGWAPFSMENSTENPLNPSLLDSVESEGFQGENYFKGLGCFPGVVEGEVVVVQNPQQAQNLKGKILCAVRTDPGWTPLFVQIKGLLVERGSSLSHSAIVAREMGIPTVVGIANLTKILKTGDRVKLDGAHGLVIKDESDDVRTSSNHKNETTL